MKFQMCLLFALVAFAAALPVPDEEITLPIQAAVSDDNAEKKINLIDDTTADSKATKPESKDEAAFTPELKSAAPIAAAAEEKLTKAEEPIAKAEAPIIKDEPAAAAPAERKLDIVVPEQIPSQDAVVAAPAVVAPVEPVAIVLPEVRSAPAADDEKILSEEKAAETPAEAVKIAPAAAEPLPIAAAIAPKELAVAAAEEKPIAAEVALTEDKVELKSEERQTRGDAKIAEPEEKKEETPAVAVAEPAPELKTLLPAVAAAVDPAVPAAVEAEPTAAVAAVAKPADEIVVAKNLPASIAAVAAAPAAAAVEQLEKKLADSSSSGESKESAEEKKDDSKESSEESSA